jgi:hypothetical protein
MKESWYSRQSNYALFYLSKLIHANRVLYGMTGPSFISLVGPVAATLYGTYNLATLIGLLNVFYIPGK